MDWSLQVEPVIVLQLLNNMFQVSLQILFLMLDCVYLRIREPQLYFATNDDKEDISFFSILEKYSLLSDIFVLHSLDHFFKLKAINSVLLEYMDVLKAVDKVLNIFLSPLLTTLQETFYNYTVLCIKALYLFLYSGGHDLLNVAKLFEPVFFHLPSSFWNSETGDAC